jgi:hypothetical protein
LSVTFDDDHAVAEAGLALVAVLSEKLGLEALADQLVDVAPSRSRVWSSETNATSSFQSA